MKSKTLALALLGLAAAACQPEEYVNPVDANTGTPPDDATVLFSFDALTASPFLDANLAASMAPTAAFTTTGGALTPITANGSWPAEAGSDADLVGGVGFGTYSNPDLLGEEAVDWSSADPFQAVLTAEIILNNPGDGVKFCRSFATTCATVTLDASGTPMVLLDIAANVPDTEIGEISAGVSAAIRGTGDSGLTIALTDMTEIVVPIAATAGTPFSFTWTTSRGATEGTLDYTIAIDGTELDTGNTGELMMAGIAKTGGVTLMFDAPLAIGGAYDINYSYSYMGMTGVFTPVEFSGTDVEGDLATGAYLGYTPLFVYPTLDPTWELLTLTGEEGISHPVRYRDGIVGAITERIGEHPTYMVYSTAFDGDDFEGTVLAGLVDQGIAGGGFYPSPSFCYSQILPTVQGGVEAAVQEGVRIAMYQSMVNGSFAIEPFMMGAAAYLAVIGDATTFTPIGEDGGGPTGGYIAFAEDYANSNVATNITTSAGSAYVPVYARTESTTTVTEVNTIIAKLEADSNTDLLAFLAFAGLSLDDDWPGIKMFQAGASLVPGVMDGRHNGADPVYDEADFDPCEGYQCMVDIVALDAINGTNLSGMDPSGGIPALAGTCLWGVAASPEVPARVASFTKDANPYDDFPSAPAIPATAAMPPVRELAAASMSELVVGVFGNFVSAAYGPTVPASNFSLKMMTADPAAEFGPAITTMTVTTE